MVVEPVVRMLAVGETALTFVGVAAGRIDQRENVVVVGILHWKRR